jgi:CO/xanthine dehydrogenase Mo-binding subunit
MRRRASWARGSCGRRTRFLTTGGVYTEDVLAVFTGPDLAALPSREDAGTLNQEIRQQPLATGIVRFVGKAAAAVVTEEQFRGTGFAAI